MNGTASQGKSGGYRELLPDAVKALAIIFVVWGHAIQYFHGVGYDYWSDPVFKFIYSFHMPIFSWVSGYLFSRSLQRYTTLNLIFRKAKTLLLPCISWAFLFGGVSFFGGGMQSGSTPSLRTFILVIVSEMIGNYWFLKAVFVGCVFVLAIEKYLSGHWSIYVLLCASTLLWPRGDTIAFVLPYFIIGYIYGKKNERILFSLQVTIGSIIIYSIALFAYTKESYIYISGMNILSTSNPLRQLGICLFRFGIGLVGCVGFMGILNIVPDKVKRAYILRRIGENTGVIYILTTPFFIYSSRIIKKIGVMVAQDFPISFIYNGGLFLFSIALILATIKLSELLERFAWVKSLLLGK